METLQQNKISFSDFYKKISNRNIPKNKNQKHSNTKQSKSKQHHITLHTRGQQ